MNQSQGSLGFIAQFALAFGEANDLVANLPVQLGCVPSHRASCLASEPKLTSVPASSFVAATGSLGSQPARSRGAHPAVVSHSSVYSMPRKK